MGAGLTVALPQLITDLTNAKKANCPNADAVQLQQIIAQATAEANAFMKFALQAMITVTTTDVTVCGAGAGTGTGKGTGVIS